MHDCQKLREDLTDLVLDNTPPDPSGSMFADLNSCEDCVHFYEDALAVVKIVKSAEVQPPELPEEYWAGFDDRFRSSLLKDRLAPAPLVRPRRHWLRSTVFAAAAAVFIGITVLISRAMHPLVDDVNVAPAQTQGQVIDQMAGLDMATIDYLGQSELFLRSFVKIEPTDIEDLEDARTQAQMQLVALNQRKEAAADFMPVEAVLDDYETVLRDINNVGNDSPEDIADIQDRIQRNGLIANMKAYQPRIVVTEYR